MIGQVKVDRERDVQVKEVEEHQASFDMEKVEKFGIMEHPGSRYERLDNYLAQMEAYEKAKKVRRWLGIVLVLTLGIAAGIYYFSDDTPAPINTKPLRRFAANSLTPERVNQLFVDSPSPLVLIHPVLGTDTITSVLDYYEFLNRLDLMSIDYVEEGEDIQTAEIIPQAEEVSTQTEPASADTDIVPEFQVVLKGEKRVGKALAYTIENYDPAYELTLDFGNGIKRKVRRETTEYVYPLPGHFDMHLMLSQGDSTQILHTLKYQIFPKENVAESETAGETGNSQRNRTRASEETPSR
ncbi:MAG: hypothetical protein AAFR59_07720 [Bacteroidota bacterium]